MAIDLSFIGRDIAPLGVSNVDVSEPQADPNVAAVQQLLSMLSFGQEPQPPPRPGRLSAILGPLGDAISSMASVRAGGGPQPVGPFAARQREQQLAYEQERQATASENRRAKNEAVIALVKQRGQQQRAFRPQLKTFNTVDESGRPVDVPYLFDPNTQTLQPVGGHEQGFYKFVRPFLAQGLNQETGELEFRLVDPFTGGAPAGPPKPTATPGGAPRTDKPPAEATPAGGGLSNLEPKPTTAEMESAESASVIKDQLSQFKNLAAEYTGQARMLGTVRAVGQNFVRDMPGGQVMSETFGDPAFEELSTLRDRIGQQLARLVENGRLSDQDRDFALRNLPRVPSLTTPQGRLSAAAKINLVEREISLRLERKKRLRPGLFPVHGTTQSETAPAKGTALDRARALIRQRQGER
jgi:hypothetical protein